jgi:hypothetical protein
LAVRDAALGRRWPDWSWCNFLEPDNSALRRRISKLMQSGDAWIPCVVFDDLKHTIRQLDLLKPHYLSPNLSVHCPAENRDRHRTN